MASTNDYMTPTTMEFAVDMTDTSSEKVKELMNSHKDIKLLDISPEKRYVVLETTMPSGAVQSLLEESGNTVVFRGHGYSQGQGHIGAAVVHVMGDNINGVVRFVQTTENNCIIDGTIEGLSVGKHGLHINTLGDLSNGCQSTGSHFNPTSTLHGDRTDSERHVGDLGNIESNHYGRSVFRFQDEKIKVWDVIGRSLVVDAKEDKFHEDTSCSDGIACGIIARSAGLFENIKKVCQCSGKTLWEERREVKQGLASQL